jgi:hypothetical protein
MDELLFAVGRAVQFAALRGAGFLFAKERIECPPRTKK